MNFFEYLIAMAKYSCCMFVFLTPFTLRKRGDKFKQNVLKTMHKLIIYLVFAKNNTKQAENNISGYS